MHQRRRLQYEAAPHKSLEECHELVQELKQTIAVLISSPANSETSFSKGAWIDMEIQEVFADQGKTILTACSHWSHCWQGCWSVQGKSASPVGPADEKPRRQVFFQDVMKSCLNLQASSLVHTACLLRCFIVAA